MSSSLTYTLRKRRTSPASSRRCGFRSGNFPSSTENSSARLLAEHVMWSAPAVKRRRAVGIWTVIVISILHGFWDRSLGDFQSFVEVFVELGDLRWDGLFRLVLAHQHIRSLQAIPGDAKYRSIVGRNTTLPVELARAADSDSAGGLSEDAFGLRQKLDGRDQFRIGDVLGPTASFRYGFDGIVAVSRVANGERTRQRR